MFLALFWCSFAGGLAPCSMRLSPYAPVKVSVFAVLAAQLVALEATAGEIGKVVMAEALPT